MLAFPRRPEGVDCDSVRGEAVASVEGRAIKYLPSFQPLLRRASPGLGARLDALLAQSIPPFLAGSSWDPFPSTTPPENDSIYQTFILIAPWRNGEAEWSESLGSVAW